MITMMTVHTPSLFLVASITITFLLLLLLLSSQNVQAYSHSPQPFVKRAISDLGRRHDYFSSSLNPSSSSASLSSATMDTRRFYRDGNEQDFPFLRVASSSAAVVTPSLPSSPLEQHELTTPLLQHQEDAASSATINPLELPARRHRINVRRELEDGAEKVEMALGRLAMVTAMVLFAVEITTGQSLPDQITAFTSTFA